MFGLFKVYNDFLNDCCILNTDCTVTVKVANFEVMCFESRNTFVPTMKGEYKVNVYVQSSDNSTINKTYTYTAADDVTEPTTVVVPTTAPQPTTVQPKLLSLQLHSQQLLNLQLLSQQQFSLQQLPKDSVAMLTVTEK